MTRGFLGPLLVLLGGAPVAISAQTPSITLDEAIRRAQQIQPQVVQARGSARTAEAQVRSAKGEYLPDLTASSTGSTIASEGPTRLNPVTNQLLSGNQTATSVRFGVSSSVDLFTGFRRGADRRAAKATREAADAGLVDAQSQVTLAATQQFLEALAAEQLVRVREASVAMAEEQLSTSIAKLRVGSATRSDSLRSLVSLGTARGDLVTQQSTVAGAQAALGRLVGADAPVSAADDSSFYGVLPGLDTAAIQAEAVAHSPLVQNAEASARAAEAQLAASRSAYWPTLSLSGSASWSGSKSLDYQLYPQRQIALSLSWTLFNGFSRELTIETSRAALDNAEATAADARREVRSSLTTQFAALDAAWLRIDITKTSIVAAEEDLRVVRERYRVGVATILDVLTSEQALTQAQVDAVNARFDYLRAKAQIEALIGRRL